MPSMFFLMLGFLDIFGALLAIVAMKLDQFEAAAIFVLSLIIFKGLWTVATSWM
jgi:hypothetical protein